MANQYGVVNQGTTRALGSSCVAVNPRALSLSAALLIVRQRDNIVLPERFVPLSTRHLKRL